MAAAAARTVRAVDIGANLLDDMFQGVYHGKTLHLPDLGAVLQRAAENGVEKCIVTCGAVEDAGRGAELARQYPAMLRSTIGIHPTESSRAPPGWQDALLDCYDKHKDFIVAIGEAGLDAERTHFAPMEAQRAVFEAHFALCERTGLPMFIHSRGCHDETIATLTRHRHQLVGGGVVHSFDGSLADMQALLALNLYLGFNGCSLRTPESLEVAKAVPINRILVESDAPWCGFKSSHASHAFNRFALDSVGPVLKKEKMTGNEGKAMVRDRNEPLACLSVLSTIANLKNIPVADLAVQVYENSLSLFKWKNV